jgi:hypothetical protein
MNNIKPKERNERVRKLIIKLTNKNREIVERTIINERLLAIRKPSERTTLNNTDPKSSLFIAESERFNKDFASFDNHRRAEDREKRKKMYENVKKSLFDREIKRWQRMDYEYLKEENRIIHNKEINLVGRKNQLG